MTYDVNFASGDIDGKEKVAEACHSDVVEDGCKDAAEHGEGEDVGPRNCEEVGANARSRVAEGDGIAGAVSIDQA
jgi:hypothetical protein